MLLICRHIDAKIILLKQIHSYLLLASLLPYGQGAIYYQSACRVYRILIEGILEQRKIYESDTISFNVINFDELLPGEDKAANAIRKAS